MGEASGIAVITPPSRHISDRQPSQHQFSLFIFHMKAADAIRSSLWVPRWRSLLHHLPSPLAKWRPWKHEAANGQCFPSPFALRWHNSHFLGNLKPTITPGEQSVSGGSCQHSEERAVGFSLWAHLFPTNNPWEVFSKLILTPAAMTLHKAEEEFVKRQEFVKRRPVITGHRGIQ